MDFLVDRIRDFSIGYANSNANFFSPARHGLPRTLWRSLRRVLVRARSRPRPSPRPTGKQSPPRWTPPPALSRRFGGGALSWTMLASLRPAVAERSIETGRIACFSEIRKKMPADVSILLRRRIDRHRVHRLDPAVHPMRPAAPRLYRIMRNDYISNNYEERLYDLITMGYPAGGRGRPGRASALRSPAARPSNSITS